MADFDFPLEFRTRQIATNGTSIHVRSGGAGPAVLRAAGQTSSPALRRLVITHNV